MHLHLSTAFVVVVVGTLVHTDALARFGYALSDAIGTQISLTLRKAPQHPSDLAEAIGVSRQTMSSHLTCLPGCGLVVAVPEGRRARYRLFDSRIGHALDVLQGVVLVVDPSCCAEHGCAC